MPQSVWVTSGFIIWLMLCLWMPCAAQITTTMTPDGTMGTRVQQEVSTYHIDGGTLRGANLFHSFDQFRLGTGDTASFVGPPSGIDNIISRVTGSESSMIDGTLHTAMPDANLFLLNPSGVMFGANARLDISGSFHVSTAQSLHFSDGTTLNTESDTMPVLSAAPPVAFGFMTSTPAPIEIEGSMLEVPEGEALLVVGGDIRMTGGATLGTAQGMIRLVGVRTERDVALDVGAAPVYMGAIDIVDGARIDVSGAGGGRIVVEGGEVLIDDAALFAETTGAGTAGLIDIQVHTLRLKGDGLISTNSLENSRGEAGDIVIAAASLVRVSDRARIQSLTPGAGAAGDITIRAETMIAEGETWIETTALESSTNGAGDVDLQVTALTVSDAVIRSATFGPGDAGRVTIEAVDIDINTGGLIAASQLRGLQEGNAGEIVIVADRLRVGGFNNNPRPLQSRITSSTAGKGNAGSITIRTGQLLVEAGGRIATRTAPRSEQRDIVPEGQSGAIDIAAQEVIVNGGEVLSTTRGAGHGGDVLITAHNIRLTDDGAIAVDSNDQGDAGRIQITATGVFHSENSAMTTESDEANGGDITLEAQRIFLLESAITAEAMGSEQGTSNGGNVTVIGEQVVLNQSVIQANAFGGAGGNIEIRAAGVYLASPDSRLDASSALDLSGTVEITSPVVDLTGAVVPLSSTFDVAATLLSSHCAARLQEVRGASLVARGRDSMPVAPDWVLPSLSIEPPALSLAPSAWPERERRRRGRHLASSTLIALKTDCVH